MLPGGGRMPLLGFGTWQMRATEAVRATASALRAGYRHIDTATMYGNEGEVGTALRDSGIDRHDVFVTTKLPVERAGSARSTLEDSLRLLQIDVLDLWLIHWPPGGDDAALWDQFIAAREDGLVRDVGVSNYSLDQIDRLSRSGVTPAVNQIRWSPLLFDAAVLQGHRDRGVVLEGYSALRGGALRDAAVGEIAGRIGRTPAQVIIRWHLQHGVVVIPKSQDDGRIASNADVGAFELSASDMEALDHLGR
jgi:diketogulonate reductase-like aldo/keto reductase